MKTIEFMYPCHGCRFRSPQSAFKPTWLKPTTGWLQCPECLSQVHVHITLTRDAEIKRMNLAVLEFRASERLLEMQRAGVVGRPRLMLPP